ncbi:MAG TPA: biosynthetic peptidoglycan transglycosylase, partial [Acidobacteriota bacterium]|nr:biosynthetic peptidoglycan transglycosylase [Acidobacteriota bacterium]
MREKLKKAFRIAFRVAVVIAVFMFCYTIYCLFAVPNLCDLSTTNPKTTAFQEMRKRQWEEKKLKRRLVQYWVPLAAISRHLKDAVITAEDPNFFNHHGLDFYQIWMAMQEDWEDKHFVLGASTITQQLMKNLYLSPARNPLRKWKEAILTLRVERCVKKNRLLELYLNEIEWG